MATHQGHLPHRVVSHFDQEPTHVRGIVDLYPVQPGERSELPNATWEVVRTTHTDHSVGFIMECSQMFAYLVDGVVPPPDTVAPEGS